MELVAVFDGNPRGVCISFWLNFACAFENFCGVMGGIHAGLEVELVGMFGESSFSSMNKLVCCAASLAMCWEGLNFVVAAGS